MYQCHIHFYLIGYRNDNNRIFEIIKGMTPFDHFSHQFSESYLPEKDITEKANVIFAYLCDTNANEIISALTADKKSDTELILISDNKTDILKNANLSYVKDIWTLPMSDEEIEFRFQRWQQSYKMSKDLWETNHFLEATIDNTPNLIWYKDKCGKHEKVNNSFCKTVNKTKKQVEGRGHAYIWDVEHDDPACIESELEVMRTERTCVSEETIQTGDGTKLLTTYKSPLYDLDGSVMGTVGVAIDITQERAYEQEIIKKNKTLETIFTTLDCGIICHSIDGSRILSINTAALKILGYESQEDLLTSGFKTVAPSVMDEDKPKLREKIKMLKKEGDSVSLEYRVQHDNGEILHIMGNVKLLRENGELFYQRFLLDCTDQKLHEKKEREEIERRQIELIQALSVDYNLVCFYDLDTGMGNSLRIAENSSKELVSVFNGEISLKSSLEEYIQNFVYEEDQNMLLQAVSQEHLKSVLSEDMIWHINYRTIKDNEMKYYQVKVVRIGNWDKGNGVVMGFRSVDDEIKSEMEQKNLLEEALQQANRANKAKSVFLSNMSHDIRTPMNAIVGFTSLAINHINNKEQVEEYLKKIMTSGNHLLSLLNDVLDMSRIESGRMHLDEKPCSLPEVLHGLQNILQADVHAKQLDLYIDAVDILDEEIYCDKLRLNQVLLNLLSNAVKYTTAGGIVSMRVTEKPGAPSGHANYEFIIKDTGIGMNKEFLEHIFEPFERERNSTISGIQGTGLGMTITKNIIDMMQGSIDIKSEPGIGTEVTVLFTFRLNIDEKENHIIPQFNDFRALVVDDDFNTCDSVSHMLEQIGMRADWTLSGKEAVLRTRQANMRKDNYSVYIIDWLLPDMNGIEVTRRIRKEMGDDVPVIVLTAYDWSDIEDEAKEAGVTAFCGKPLFLSELKSCLCSVTRTDNQNENESDGKASKHRTGRILLTEDNELNQEIAMTILTEAGFTVDIADNGQIAVDILKKSEAGYYQLVLMDVQMPVMNGYDAAKAIRSLEDPEIASIPILAMTANAFEEDKQDALKCGMNGHIAKPIDVEKLFEVLDKILN